MTHAKRRDPKSRTHGLESGGISSGGDLRPLLCSAHLRWQSVRVRASSLLQPYRSRLSETSRWIICNTSLREPGSDGAAHRGRARYGPRLGVFRRRWAQCPKDAPTELATILDAKAKPLPPLNDRSASRRRNTKKRDFARTSLPLVNLTASEIPPLRPMWPMIINLVVSLKLARPCPSCLKRGR